MHHNLATSGWFHSPTHLQSVFCVGGFFINCCAGPPSDELFFLSSCRHLTPPFPPYPWPWHLGPLKEKKKGFYFLIQAKVTRLVCRSSFAIEDIGWVGLSRALVFLDCGFRGPETHFWNFVFLLLCLFVVVCLLWCLWCLVFWLSFDDFFKINLVMDWP